MMRMRTRSCNAAATVAQAARKKRKHDATVSTTQLETSPIPKKKIESKYFKKEINSDQSLTAITKSNTSKKVTSAKRKRAKKDVVENLSPKSSPDKRLIITPIKPALPPGKVPDDFVYVWELVELLRADRDAPVDLHGVEALSSKDKNLSEAEREFSALVALMLSSQTKDHIVGEAVRNLQKEAMEAGQEFGPAFILTLKEKGLHRLLGKVGFWNNKTRYMLGMSQLLLDETFAPEDGLRKVGRIPRTTEALTSLPGIGPKMAFLGQLIAFGSADGLAVDTHMHRIFHDLKWISTKDHKKGPDATRVCLESWLPKQYWANTNYLFVGFGQQAQQRRELMLRKCCGVCKTSVFPRARSGDALELLARCGGIKKQPGSKYLQLVVKETKETPLMWACQSGWEEAVNVLLEHGLDPLHCDVNGKTAADYARLNGHKELAKRMTEIMSTRNK
eukprot:m.345910 g.345910  ORF g.345910 m.345910 type:complete len:448 (-) comp27554_c0_seq1:64-1407(-)